MKKLLKIFHEYLKMSDYLLLALCIICTLFGIILIASATNSYGSSRYVIVQLLALFIGVGLYVLLSVIDIEVIAEKWQLLFVFNILFIASLFLWGVSGSSGNRNWLRFFGIGIQPAEVVKITFIVIMARRMTHLKERNINSALSVAELVLHFGIVAATILIASSDMGSALVYLFIFVCMMFSSGLKFYWFLIAGAVTTAVWPYIWNNLFDEYQRNRVLVIFDPSIDPQSLGVGWQAKQSKMALAAGQFWGQGLFNGTQTQSSLSSALPEKHNDFIFAVAGEELGMFGCLIILALLTAIIIRCIYIGVKSNSSMGMLVCTGVASMMIFQTFENIGMCIGLTPVIGITLPFFSYGGSSVFTLFAAMGIVSGISKRPTPRWHHMSVRSGTGHGDYG